MVSIGDFEKIWKWAQVKWWRFPIAVFAVVLMLVLAYLNMFIKTEERLQVLTSCYSQLVSWFGMHIMSKYIMKFIVGSIPCVLLVLLVWLLRDYTIYIVYALVIGSILLVIYTICTFINWTLEMRDY